MYLSVVLGSKTKHYFFGGVSQNEKAQIVDCRILIQPSLISTETPGMLMCLDTSLTSHFFWEGTNPLVVWAVMAQVVVSTSVHHLLVVSCVYLFIPACSRAIKPVTLASGSVHHILVKNHIFFIAHNDKLHPKAAFQHTFSQSMV